MKGLKPAVVIAIALLVSMINAFASPQMSRAHSSPSTLNDAPLSAVAIVTEAGFNGYIKPGNWIPVHVTLNANEPVEGNIALSPLQDRSQRYGVDVSLARNTKKQLLLYAPPSNGPIEALFSSAGTVIGASNLTIHPLGDGDRLILVISDPSDGFNFLNDLHTPYGGMTYVAQMRPEQIPGYTPALNSVDVIIFNNIDTLALSAVQRDAIRVWVLGGGRLVLSGGPGARLTLGGFEDFAPARVGQSLQRGTVAGLRDLLIPNNVEVSAVVSTSKPVSSTVLKPADLIAPLVVLLPATNDAHSLVSSNDTPLIMRRQMGRGTVDQLAFDAAIAPLRDWDDVRFVFASFLGGIVGEPGSNSALREASMAINAARALPGASLPPFLIVAGFLLLYVIVIGPLNFYVLRRLNKLAWAWITVPGAVVLFAIIGYATGFRLHGNEPQVHRLSIITGDAQVTEARSQAIVGIFSPRRTLLDVATGHHLAEEIQPNPNQPDKVTFQFSEPNRLEKVAATNNDVRAFYLQGESILPRIEADLDFIPGRALSDTSMISGEIRNESSAAFKDCVLIVGKDYHAIGDIAPNAHVQSEVKLLLGKPQMSLVLPASRVTTSGYVSSLGTNSGHNSRSSSVPTVFRSPFDMDGASLAEIILNWRSYPDRLSEQAERGLVTAVYNNPTANAGTGVSLACWEDIDRVGAQVNDASYTDRGLRIWRLPVHPFLAGSSTVLPPDIFSWRIASSSSGVSLDQNGLTMQPGEHIIAITPWLNVRATGKVNVALGITASSNTSAAALRNSSVSVFDWGAQQFTRVITSVAVGPPTVALSGAYLSPSGELRVRVSVRDDDIMLTNVQTAVQFP